MRRGRSWAAVAVGLALVVLATPAAPASLTSQDDAGSGRDAPPTFGEALPIEAGLWYEGRLEASCYLGPCYPAVGAVVDDEDWYRVYLQAGQVIGIDLAVSGGSLDLQRRAVKLDLTRPDGVTASGTSADSAGHPQSHNDFAMADVSGWWGVRVRAFWPPLAPGDLTIPYRFRITSTPPEPTRPGILLVGRGYLGFGIELGEGGRAFTELVHSGNSGTETHRADVWRIGNGWWSLSMERWGIGDRAVVQLGSCCRAEASVDVLEFSPSGRILQFWWRGPGRFYVVYLHDYDDSYLELRSVEISGGRFLGATTGSRLIAIRPEEFRSLAVAYTDALSVPGVMVEGEATISVSHSFLGVFQCDVLALYLQLYPDACSMRFPDGTQKNVPGGHLAILDPPGTYTFKSRLATYAPLFVYALFGADLVLPGMGQ